MVIESISHQEIVKVKKSRILVLAFGLFVVVLGIALGGLASASIAPHAQTIEKTIPDDQIPH